jgi:uncharacterized delta-60 repeat protein
VRGAAHLKAHAALGLIGLGVLATALLYPPSASAREGDLDPQFGAHGLAPIDSLPGRSAAEGIEVLSDNQLVVAGWFRPPEDPTAPKPFLAKLGSDGALDKSFGSGGVVRPLLGLQDAYAYEVEAAPDGRLLVRGDLGNSGGHRSYVARFLPDGSVDASFSDDGVLVGPDFTRVLTIAVDADDGTVALGGYGGPGDDPFVAKLTERGDPDPTFSLDGIAEPPQPGGTVVDLEIDSANRIISAQDYRDGRGMVISRLLPSGAPDLAFSDDGAQSVPCSPSCGGGPLRGGAFGLALMPDGDYVATGAFCGLKSCAHAIMRVDANGDFDPAFGVGGYLADASANFGNPIADANGGILTGGGTRIGVGGDPGGFQLNRLLPSGQHDEAFGEGGYVTINPTPEHDQLSDIGLQSDGRIVAPGHADYDALVARFLVTPGGPADRDADGRADRKDACPRVYSTDSSGCPTASGPKIVLRYRKEGPGTERKPAFTGYILSPDRVCGDGGLRPIIRRRKRGDDTTVGRADSGYVPEFPGAPDGAGSFILEHRAKPGIYYATTERRHQPLLGICKQGRSRGFHVK